MKILTADQLRRIDNLSGDTLALMEHAGEKVVEAIAETAETMDERFDNLADLKILILCGKGNNGGDGFVVARLLLERGCRPQTVLFADEQEVGGDAAVNLQRILDTQIHAKPFNITSEKAWETFAKEQSPDLIVDAMLGTGLTRPVEGLYGKVIPSLPLNFPDAVIVSVDIPSGLAADRADVLGPAVIANVTVTFTALKHCLVFPPAHRHAGHIVVADIGVPSDLVHSPEHGLNFITPDDFPDALHRRSEDTHKGDYGRVLVLGGSRGKSGAAAMAGQAALRSGAGLVTVATPSSCASIVAGFMAELMTYPLPETAAGTLADVPISDVLTSKTVIAIGPGIGTEPETQAFARRVVREANAPVVLDADGLNAFVGHLDELRGRSAAPLVITPHPGEMARLLGTSSEAVNAHRIETARRFATEHDLIVVLKGFRTVIAAPDASVYINATGNPGMASGGMGDILTGMLAGILAQQNLGTFLQRVLFAVYLHGLAGDLAADDVGEEPLVATDLLGYLGAAWEQVRE